MENCRANRNSCRMALSGSSHICRMGCRNPGPSHAPEHPSGYSLLDSSLPAAMGYVPFQKWSAPFDLCKGLQLGTIFPDLCKPFCGKGGAVCR